MHDSPRPSSGASRAPAELRLLAELIADVLAERGLFERPEARARVLDAAEAAEHLGRDRSWVYAHAEELGAFRYGDGPRARLGFDLVFLEQWKQQRRAASLTADSRPRRTGSPKRGVNLLPFDPLDG